MEFIIGKTYISKTDTKDIWYIWKCSKRNKEYSNCSLIVESDGKCTYHKSIGSHGWCNNILATNEEEHLLNQAIKLDIRNISKEELLKNYNKELSYEIY